MAESRAEAPKCPLCTCAGVRLYEGLSDRLFDAPGSYSLQRCSGCDLVWLDPRPEPEELGQLYRDYYTHATHDTHAKPEARGAHRDSHERSDADVRLGRDRVAGGSMFQRAVTLGIPAARLGYADAWIAWPERALGRLLAWLPPLRDVGLHAAMWLPAPLRGHLLDVGCGSGELLARMHTLGWQVTGVEPDPGGAQATRALLGSDAIVVEDLSSPELKAGSFDAITLAHVVEHLLDPAETLRRCRELLVPKGWLVCVTPNAQSLGARSFGQNWLHWDPPRHLQIFSPGNLTQLFRECGFEIQQSATPSSTAHFSWQASTLLERRGRLPGVELGGAVSPALFAESLGFWAWELLQTRLGRRCGEEVLVIARKAVDPKVDPKASPKVRPEAQVEAHSGTGSGPGRDGR